MFAKVFFFSLPEISLLCCILLGSEPTLSIPITKSVVLTNQPGVEPRNCLVESLLLGVSLDLLARVTADREAVGDAAVQVDLVRVAALGQDLLGLVALLGGEDLVRLGGSDGERALETGELLLVNERGVGEVADGDGRVVASHVLRKTQVQYILRQTHGALKKKGAGQI
jgi:hypothetical protein